MKKKLFVSLVVIMVLSVMSIPAVAGPPENAGGAWHYMPYGIELIKVAGGNTFMTVEDDGIWTGTFDGDSVDFGPVVIYSSGAWLYKGTVSFIGDVHLDGGSKTGSLEMRVNGWKPAGATDWEGLWVITGGVGELAGLQGQGTWWGPGYDLENPLLWGEIDYSGNLHFEP